MKIIFALTLVMMLSAFTVDKTLPDAAEEARAQNLFREIKCVVCQGQPIGESDASIAVDMRKLIRGKITAGATDAEIIDYLETRYGAGIATTPPVESSTLLLWFGPFALLAVGAGLLFFRRNPRKRG